MADERDLELLDDYLSNRMAADDQAAFARKLRADPDLQHEYALQKRLIQGIRDVRAAELKAMLNKVPVPSGGTGSTLAGKLAVGVAISLVLAGACYWYFSTDQVRHAPAPVHTEERSRPGAPAVDKSETRQPEAPAKAEPKQPVVRKTPPPETDKNQTSAGTEHSKPSLAKRPDPLHSPAPQTEPEPDADLATDQLVVEANKPTAEYGFHYQFTDGKLILFGPFAQNNYETVELMINDSSALFLFYNGQYYALERSEMTIQPLKPVTDPDILQRLSVSRAAH